MENISRNELEWLYYIKENTPIHEELVEKFKPKSKKPFDHLKTIEYVIYENIDSHILKYQITERGKAYIEYREAIARTEKFHKTIMLLTVVISLLAVGVSVIAILSTKTVYVTLPPL